MGPRTSHRVAGLLGHSELNDCFDRFGQARERQVFEVVTLCTGHKVRAHDRQQYGHPI
jgi:hypothetical protein